MLSASSTGKSEPAFWVSDLSKTYSAPVLDSISLSVERGESVGLVGPNGAGKSTLIKILLGLVRPTSGDGQLLSTPLSSVGGHHQVSYLPELPGFWAEISAYEYLKFSRRLQVNKPSLEIAELLARVGLKERGKRPMSTYSKGMVQRTGIAWALQREPEIYVLDEPMSGLDPRAQAMLREVLVEEHKKGRTLFISSHSFEDISALCSRVIVLNHNKIEFDGSPAEAFDRLRKEFSDQKGWDEDYD
jgi:ABC-2 type transport system ATP-binding protein